MKTYTNLCRIQDFIQRYRYLKLGGHVGEETFGYDRYLNQLFYNSPEWRKLRNDIILRDDGCDLGLPGFRIGGKIYIHHINPITLQDINARTDSLMDPENLICVSFDTHNAIHYGDETLLFKFNPPERKPFDTCPWR